MKTKPMKILFFTNGPAPTIEQIAEAEAFNGNVAFRNARVVPSENHALEECDGVAGEVPAIYSAKFPTAAAALEARAAKIAALSAKVGDEPAPKPPAAAPEKPASTAKADAKAPTPPATPETPASAAPAGAAPGWTAPAKGK